MNALRLALWIGAGALALYGASRLGPSFVSDVLPSGDVSSPSPGNLPDLSAQPDQQVSNDADILARTIYGEARGEGASGMEAVANVVMNRVAAGNFPGGRSVAAVCQAPWQFSCWNAGDPNLSVIEDATASDPGFAQALSIAQEAIAGALPDSTGGATLYHDTSIATPSAWGIVQQTASIGSLKFFA